MSAVPALFPWEKIETGPIQRVAPLMMETDVRHKWIMDSHHTCYLFLYVSYRTLDSQGLFHVVKLLIEDLQWLISVLYFLRDKLRNERNKCFFLRSQNTNQPTVWFFKKKFHSKWVYLILTLQFIDFVVQLSPCFVHGWTAGSLTETKMFLWLFICTCRMVVSSTTME